MRKTPRVALALWLALALVLWAVTPPASAEDSYAARLITARSSWGQLQPTVSQGLTRASTSGVLVVKNVGAKGANLSAQAICTKDNGATTTSPGGTAGGNYAAGATWNYSFTCPAGTTVWQVIVGGREAVCCPAYSEETWQIEQPAPPTSAACGTSGDFKGVTSAVTDGTLDLTWKWQGTVPTRGWKMTDAAANAPTGTGATLTTIPATTLPQAAGRYGLIGYTVTPNTVKTIRVEQVGKPACFLTLALGRDADGNLTGVTIGGVTPPDTTPDPGGATDEGGAGCGLIPPDFPCILKYLFVPKPSSWGFDALMTQIKTRPPFSVVVNVGQAVSGVVSSYSNGGCVGIPLNVPYGNNSNGEVGNYGNVFNCTTWKNSGSGQWVFGLMKTFLYVTTGLVLWGQARDAIDP